MRLVRIWILLGLVLGGSVFGAGVDARQTPVASGQPRCMAEAETDVVLTGILDGVVVNTDSFASEVGAYSVETCEERWTWSKRNYQVIGARVTDDQVIVRAMRTDDYEKAIFEPDADDRPEITVVALNPATGERNWSREIETGFSPISFTVTNRVVIMDGPGGVVVIDVANGDTLWTNSDFGGYAITRPYASDHVIIRYKVDSSTGSEFHAYDLETGTQLWQSSVGPGSDALYAQSASVEHHQVILTWAVELDESVVSMTSINDADTGESLWTRKAFVGFDSLPLSNLVVANQSDGIESMDVVVLDLETGVERYLAPSTGLISGVWQRNDVVVGVSSQMRRGSIVASGIDLSTGSMIWEIDLPGGISWGGAWAVEGDDLFAATDSFVYVVDLMSGVVEASFELPTVESEMLVSETGWCPYLLDDSSLRVTEDLIVVGSCEANFAIFDRP